MGSSERGEEKNRTAILLLDFQNEFVKKGGELHEDVAAVMEKVGTLENAATLLEFARYVQRPICSDVLFAPIGSRNRTNR